MQTLALPARRLGPPDEEWAAVLLTEAYAADPAYQTLWGPDVFEPLLMWMQLLVRYGLREGCLYTSPGEHAVALWLPDKAVPLSWGQLLRGGQLSLLLKLGGLTLQQLLRWQHTQDAWRYQALPVAHHYLLALGVRPAERGRGEGRNLLRASVAAVGGRYLPCFGQASTLSAVYFGQRLGFEVVAFAEQPALNSLDRLPVPSWAMVRPAAAI
ncbi:GNAT family N-acetyltransferase [Hymenobacter cellulosivorans]|uniref:N-acetyltransferase domain-containing protein n=1 Tax=Hymenobacter cellulosivorans TaxID=2932249 RepID=A0ABY4FFV8_9BACT|nr:hypothetical protein [Hymenobacter cellulosivorans]UOQ54842.1 hypothetical protein MUN80_08800 [Hymenobacter cellulosivorans]